MSEVVAIGLLVWFLVSLLVGVGLGRLLRRRERAGRRAHEQWMLRQGRGEVGTPRAARRR